MFLGSGCAPYSGQEPHPPWPPSEGNGKDGPLRAPSLPRGRQGSNGSDHVEPQPRSATYSPVPDPLLPPFPKFGYNVQHIEQSYTHSKHLVKIILSPLLRSPVCKNSPEVWSSLCTCKHSLTSHSRPELWLACVPGRASAALWSDHRVGKLPWGWGEPPAEPDNTESRWREGVKPSRPRGGLGVRFPWTPYV